jgi:hypothetical protein
MYFFSGLSHLDRGAFSAPTRDPTTRVECCCKIERHFFPTKHFESNAHLARKSVVFGVKMAKNTYKSAVFSALARAARL